MSKPVAQGPAKPNYVSTILFAIAAVLMFRLWSSPPQNAPTDGGKSPTTATDVLAKMRTLDAEEPKTIGRAQAIDDEVVRQLLPSFNNFIDADVKSKKTDEAQADALKTEGAILAAHVQLRMGYASRDTNKLRMAYNTLEPFERTHATKAAWTTMPVQVTNGGKKDTITGHAFLETLVASISERNKGDLIWGAIPGGYQFIDFLVGLTGHNPYVSYWVATLLLAFAVRAVVFPLSQKQLMMSRKMSQLTPRLQEIKTKFKDNQVEANKRSMELYSRYGINPFAGCLPALVQMPLFLTVYQCILHYQFEFTRGYFLWITPESSIRSHGFFAPNLGQQDYLLIVIYSITMVISTMLTPVTDPTQAKQQRIIGIGAAVIFPIMMMLRLFPVVSGFVLYWTFTNLFSMAQSIRAYRMPMSELVEVNAPGGGVYPSKPKGRWAQMMEDMQKAAEDQQRKQTEDRPDDSDGGTMVRNPKPNGPKDKGPQSNGKVSPSRPLGEGSGAGGAGAKHKPKKRK